MAERTQADAMNQLRVKAERERNELRALWLEWLGGMYDGPDLLRRVRLAVHGPLRKPAGEFRASLSAPADQSMAQDAARYQWLRDRYVLVYGWHENPPGWPDGKFMDNKPLISARMLHGLDAAIDAARNPAGELPL